MIGERLLGLRVDADMTQDELAEHLKVNKHSISAYERNKNEPPDDIKIAIAHFFNVSVDYLLGITDIRVPVEETMHSIPLPDAFPREKIGELTDFIEFLSQKQK